MNRADDTGAHGKERALKAGRAGRGVSFVEWGVLGCVLKASAPQRRAKRCGG